MSFNRPASIVPRLVKGRWKPAKVSTMKASKIRKNALIEGKLFVGADFSKGEWDPRWDAQNAAVVMKTPRGPKSLRNRASKMERIKEALSKMDERIKEKSNKGTVPTPFLEQLFIREGIVEVTKAKKN